MTIKDIQERFISGNRIPIDKAMVPAGEWRMAMAEIQVLKDQYIWHLSEISQLQEQNTALDARLASHEAVMRMALAVLKPMEPVDRAVHYQQEREAIKALEEQLNG